MRAGDAREQLTRILEPLDPEVLHVSTCEWDGWGPPVGDSLRLITKRTGQYVAGGFPLDGWMHGPTVRENRAGFDHLSDWVDRNDPIRPGSIVTIPFFASDQSASTSQFSPGARRTGF